MSDPYTAEVRLCDDAGMVSDERVAPGAPGTILEEALKANTPQPWIYTVGETSP
jgi:hypothetical protein